MDKINILLIEDDIEINNLINDYLKKQGYSVESAFDGEEAVDKINKQKYEMVILDLMLPKIDGTEVLRIIREKNTVPVLILSAKDEQTDKIIGLGLGADDYMTKPFTLEELLARVKAQLRRFLYFNTPSEEEDKILTASELELNLETYSVKKRGSSISLTSTEFEILKLLMSNPNKVFAKSQLFTLIWGENYLCDENTVMVHIRRLRTKIEDNPSKPVYVQTVWGIGYKLGEV